MKQCSIILQSNINALISILILEKRKINNLAYREDLKDKLGIFTFRIIKNILLKYLETVPEMKIPNFYNYFTSKL